MTGEAPADADALPAEDRTGAQRRLLERIGHAFADPGLLELALTHRSYPNERRGEPRCHNERLEFLGDSVLGFIVSQLLYAAFPHKTEGQLTRMRASLVSDAHLASKARELGLGPCLQLGRGEELSGGRHKDSLLADAYESIIAALFLDGGLPAAERHVRSEFEREVRELRERPPPRDYKTRLKELCEAGGQPEPRYEVVETEGPDHRKRFHVAVHAEGGEAGRGSGASKKAAEQDAARAALATLGGPAARPPD